MTHFTPQEFEVLRLRNLPVVPDDDDTPDPGPESDLVKKIRKSIKDNGFIGFCVPETALIRKILPPGWPD